MIKTTKYGSVNNIKPLPQIKILVFALCGIGDLIMLTPTLTALKKGFPQARITVVIKHNNPPEIFKNNPSVDEVLRYPKDFLINVWSRWPKLPNKLQNIKNLGSELAFLRGLRKQKFDVSLWAFPGEGKRGAIVSALAGARIKMGPIYDVNGRMTSRLYDKTIEIDRTHHAVEDNLSYLKLLGSRATSRKLVLNLDAQSRRFASKFLSRAGVSGNDRLIGIHAGGDKANPQKRWPIERFVELANRIVAMPRAKIVVFTGPDDDDAREAFAGKEVILTKNLPIMHLAAVIERCDLVITSDSGPGHIAAALGKKTITLFGPGNPNKTRTWRNKNTIINKLPAWHYLQDEPSLLTQEGAKALRRITVNEVLREAKKVL